jgi:hypothetical protein
VDERRPVALALVEATALEASVRRLASEAACAVKQAEVLETASAGRRR